MTEIVSLPKAAITEKDRSDRSAQIRRAALKLFNEKGFSSTRLEDVAEEAGVSKGTIYLYFENKEDLFFAIIRGVVPEVRNKQREVAEHEGSLAILLKSLIVELGYKMVHTELGACVKLVAAEGRNFPEIAEYHKTHIALPGITTFKTIIDKGIAAKEFRPCDSEALASLVILPLLMSGIWKNALPTFSGMDLNKVAAMHAEHFVNGLLA
jgi:AcrR family transcriptional regulator